MNPVALRKAIRSTLIATHLKTLTTGQILSLDIWGNASPSTGVTVLDTLAIAGLIQASPAGDGSRSWDVTEAGRAWLRSA